jgi:flagellar hook-associated protein 2
MPITVDGAVSGIDTSALIQAITSGQTAQRKTVSDRISLFEGRASKISELIGKIGTMTDALEAIKEISDFRAFSATNADNDYFSVEVDGDSVAGSYDIKVLDLASSETRAGSIESSKTADLGLTGTLALTYDGTTSNIAVGSGDSLTDIASNINDIDGLSAYVMNTTTGFRLVVQGNSSGADYAVTFDESALSGSLGFNDPGAVIRSASDARISINGLEVTSSTNRFTDPVPGMTLDASALSGTDTTTVTVASDPNAIEERLETFVTAYNDVVNYVSVQSVYNQEAGIRGPFVGEGAVSRVLGGLRDIIGTTFSSLGQDYDSLSLVGIETDRNGKLSIDSDKLQDVLSDAPDQLSNLFTGSGGFIAAMLDRADVYVDSSDGSLYNRKDTLEERVSDMNDRLDAMDRRMATTQARLRRQFSALESLMSGLQGTSNYLTSLFSTSTSS